MILGIGLQKAPLFPLLDTRDLKYRLGASGASEEEQACRSEACRVHLAQEEIPMESICAAITLRKNNAWHERLLPASRPHTAII